MLTRYTRPEFLALWSEQNKKQMWLGVEIAFLAARVTFGSLSSEAYSAIRTHAKVDLARMDELEAEFSHDMIAFVVAVQESLEKAGAGQYASEFHKLLTSYDIEDPAMVMLLRRAVALDIDALSALEDTLRIKAKEHKWTLMIARTHGQYAEPDTFGHLLLVYAEAIQRGRERLQHALSHELAEAKISGAVGNYPGLKPAMEAHALDLLGLKPAKAETQILQRDRFAAVLSAIAVAGATIEQICRTFWEMMRSEIHELEEPRGTKQRGSSRMAYKKNPIATEQLQGLARLLRGYQLAALENVATPDCRDISQSSVERHILPDATALLHYMAFKLTKLVGGLAVFPDRMCKNLDDTHGVWAAQPIRDALMEAGVPYNDAYEYTQHTGFRAAQVGMPFLDYLRSKTISEADRRTALDILGEERLRSFFDPKAYIQDGIEHIFSQQNSQCSFTIK